MAFIGDLVVRITASTSQFEKAVGRSQSRLGAFASAAKGAVFSIGGALAGLGAGAAIGGMVKLAADAETLQMQLKVLTGSADTAGKVIEQLDKFAANTPFQKMEIGDATRKLLAFGSSADGVFDELKMIGDIAAATGNPIGELAELYGKAQVQGRLFGEDINQLTGRGIPIIGELAKQFGVAESEVKKLVSDGKIGFPELQKSLQAMTAPGAQFGGMMEQLSTTTAGKFSTFVDNVKLLGAEIGAQLLPAANMLLEWGTSMIGSMSGIGESFGHVLGVAGQWFTTIQGYFIDIMSVGQFAWENWQTLAEVAFLNATAGMVGFAAEVGHFFTAALPEYLIWVHENLPNIFMTAADFVGTVFGNLAINIRNAWDGILAYITGTSSSLELAWVPLADGFQNTVAALPEIPERVVGQFEQNLRNRAAEMSASVQGGLQQVIAQNREALGATAVAQTVAEAAKLSGPGATSNAIAGKQQETKFAGALEAGSADAYSAIVRAMTSGRSDPQTKATERVGKIITEKVGKPLQQLASGRGNATVVERI